MRAILMAGVCLLGLTGASMASQRQAQRDCSVSYEDVVEAQTDQGWPVRAVPEDKLDALVVYLERATGTRYEGTDEASFVRRDDGVSTILHEVLYGCVWQVPVSGTLNKIKGWD